MERPTIVYEPTKHGGFVRYGRESLPLRPIGERVQDWDEVIDHEINEPLLKTQSARCMDCGTPFCHQVLTQPYILITVVLLYLQLINYLLSQVMLD